MPQPVEVDAAALRLIDLYQQASDGLQARAQAALAGGSSASRGRRLRQLARTVDDEMARLVDASREWMQDELPVIYSMGGGQAAEVLDGPFTWSHIHSAAVKSLADDLFDDVLTATDNVSADVKAWVRQAGRRATAGSLREGETATQAGRDLARSADRPVGTITYADGARHTLADYADTLLRTKTAQTFNAGTLNTLRGAGVGWAEVIDGTSCGWTSHDDGDKANGTVRSLDDCAAHPLSHPRCRRSFAGRPDITTAADAKNAPSLRSGAQMADQAQAETDRAAANQRRSTRRARQARRARTPRTVRTARGTT